MEIYENDLCQFKGSHPGCQYFYYLGWPCHQRKIHLSRKIQYVEFYSTSFLGLQNWLILGRIAESRIRRKVQGWDMTSNYKTSNYKTSIRRNVFDVK